MEVFQHNKTWNHFIFYKQSEQIPFIFETEPNVHEHIQSKDESSLYEYRNNINTYSQSFVSNNWEYYKKIVNPYEIIYTKKKYRNFPDSVSSIKPLSRSYFKMIEILDLIHFYKQQQSIRTAHVCEGPGGFIEALYDTSVQNKVFINDTIAMTLQSTKNNIPGWKGTTSFLKKHNNIKIIYGKDNTGDIIKVENQQYYINHVSYKYDIFTADGGFDFSSNYMKQEQLVFPLLVASTKIGFEVLKQGGVFILKFIDFYNKATTDLLYFLSCHFMEWTLYKPATSRPCNPEHYFIGKGFIRLSEESIDILYRWCNILENKDDLESLLISDYSEEFTKIIEEIRRESALSQITYLKRVFDIIEQNNDNLIQRYLKYNLESSYEWCKRFNIPILISSTVFPLIEESQNVRQDSVQ
jgi:23S rRNA U2552 (ribose-2'-O)-methylase RlmE/FtsJ